MAAERPVHILDTDANLLGHLLEGLGTAYRLLDLMDALVGEAGKYNECSHRNLLAATRQTVAKQPQTRSPGCNDSTPGLRLNTRASWLGVCNDSRLQR